MNLFIGNVSSNPNCYETRSEALLLNLYSAVEQARMEGEVLPDIDVYIYCQDRPDARLTVCGIFPKQWIMQMQYRRRITSS